MKNLESKSKKEDVTRNAFKKLDGLHLRIFWQKVCALMNLKESTISSTQTYIDALITEQWVTFHLNHPDNKDFVNQPQVWVGCAASVREGPTFFKSAQLPNRRSEQKSEPWAPRN